MEHPHQVFETSSPTRWVRFKWASRVILFIFLFFAGVLVVALYLATNPPKPGLESRDKSYSASTSKDFLSRYRRNLGKIKGFKNFLDKKEKEEKADTFHHKITAEVNKQHVLIRAGFYTPWTAYTSLPDLRKNGDKLNTIFPEWFFLNNKDTHLETRIDSAGLAVMTEKNLRILPILTNFNSFLKPGPDFDGSLVHSLLNDPVKQDLLISHLLDTLNFYDFKGINIDFENLKESSNSSLTAFIKKLSERFHENGLIVTIDVEVDNSDYDYAALSKYCDYIILMAYDQFNTAANPGPISEQKWIEESLDKAAKKIDPEKIILGIAGYGYDWYKNEEGNDTVVAITYTQAINTAKIAGAKIEFDNNSYNLHYSYAEQLEDSERNLKKTHHEIWFTDAATLFNVLRFSDDYSTAGTVLWRLGSEDARMWSYYNYNLSNDSVNEKPFDFSPMTFIPMDPESKPGYIGSGEIMDIVGTPQAGKIKMEIDSTEGLIAEEDYVQLPSGYIIQKFAEDPVIGRGHKLILTFDDGPDPEWTPQILDILEREKIPASFFVVGMQVEKNIPIVQRIHRDGYEIGNHTFTHNNLATMSLSRAQVEMKLTRLLIESVTGRSTILFRAPYNADSEPQTFEELEPISRSSNENYFTIGESIDPMDWEPGVSSDTIVSRTIRQIEERNASIILFHDAGGNTRQATINALPIIIKYFKDRGYKFTSIADLMGKSYADVMPAIPSSRSGWVTKFNYVLAEGFYWTGHIIFALFLIGIILSIGRMIIMATLASIQRSRENRVPITVKAYEGLVSIIVPAYNEQVNIIRTINSLLHQDHHNFEIIVVDDGSTDSTYQNVLEAFEENNKVKIFTKPNGGKASALNMGIERSAGDVVVCIDADTRLKADAVRILTQYFDKETIGAVAGNVKVGNEVNMITKWQSIEYITSQNFDRRAFHILNCISVVPGAIGAFRKKAIEEVGGFTSDTLAEDCDITMRLHRLGYKILNCNHAISYTEAPETLKQFVKQRFRWSFGVMQSFWKNKDTLFNPRYKNFGMVAMPNILVYQILLPILAPLADLVLLVSIIGAMFGIVPVSLFHILLYYGIFMLIDIAGAALAFAFEKEDPKKLFWIIPQKFVYRQLMYYILFKSLRRAIKGELQQWGILKRTGRVKDVDFA